MLRSPLYLPAVRPVRRALCGLAAFAVLLVVAVPGASAQSSKIYVASYGNDANAGTVPAPKRNFQAAHDAVAAGGEIVVLDTAGYSTLTITKSVTITVPSGVNAFVTVGGSANAITVAAGSNDVVSLSGLIVEGPTSNAGDGIVCSSVGTLRVTGCIVRQFNYGIYLLEGSGAVSNLLVEKSSIRDTEIGVFAYSGFANATAKAVVSASTVDGASSAGLLSYSSNGGIADLTVRKCLVTNCNTGLYAEGASASVTSDNNLLSNDGTGVTTTQSGTIISLLNNTFSYNLLNGSFTSTTIGK